MNKFLVGIFTCVFYLNACASSNTYSVDKILTDNVLGCKPEPEDDISALYANVFNENTKFKKLGKDSVMIGNIKVSNIKSFEAQDKNIALSLIFDYKKNDMRIIKLAFLSSASYEENEWGGYYYVLEGSPINFENFRIKHHLDSDEITRTPSGNYRVTCVMAG